MTKQVDIILDRVGDALSQTTINGYDADFNLTTTSTFDYVLVNQTTAQTAGLTSFVAESLLRTEETTYLVNDPNVDVNKRTAYRARNLLALPTSKRVLVGGNVVEKSSMSYDEPAFPILPSGTAPSWSNPGEGIPRGNVTSRSHWLDTSDSYISLHYQYDQYGNVRKSWNAKDTTLSNPGEVEYSEAFACAYPTLTRTPVPDSTGQHGSSTAFVSTSVYDFTTGLVLSSTDPNGQTLTYDYNDPRDRLTQVTHQGNGARIRFGYSDVPNNLYMQVLTDQDERSVEIRQYYDGMGHTVRAALYDGVAPNAWSVTDTHYDSLGRVSQVSNPYRVSNPSAPLPNTCSVCSTSIYDALGRLTSLIKPDGAHVTTEYDGARVLTTDQANRQRLSQKNALDQLTDVWEITPDDLQYPGTDDVSFPSHPEISKGYHSTYRYDVRGNLRRVDQGEQRRYFLYDSLSRLIRVRNPEQGVNSELALNDPCPDSTYSNSQWSMSYDYDDNGNVWHRTDARNIRTTFAYDAQNRVISVNYENDPAATPAVTRYYDGATNGKGKIWKTQTAGPMGSLNTIDTYDALGQPRKQRQQFYSGGHWSQSYTVERTYDRAGHVLTQTYPSGHTVNYTFDQAGRTSSVTGNLGDGEQHIYASDFLYTESGAIQQEKFGTLTPLYHKQRFNERGQLWDMRLSTVSFDSDPTNGDRGAIVNYYSNNFVQGGTGTDNNGNLLRQEISIPGNGFYRENYSYDHLNRLTSVSERINGTGNDTFKQAYTYDRWGNRTIDQTITTSNVPHPGFTANVANNRLNAPAGSGPLGYDDAGNVTQDSTNPNFAEALYDAENRLKQASTAPTCYLNGEAEPICLPGSSTTSEYVYDGDGRRVRRIQGSASAPYETWQVYGMDGELLAEYPNGPAAYAFMPQKEYGYRAGQLLITASNSNDKRIQRFVTNQYFAALGRAPTAMELNQQQAAFIQAAQQGQSQFFAAAQQLGQQLFDVQNANGSYAQRKRTNTQFVTDLYFGYLQRPTEAGGLAFYVGQLDGGFTTRTALRNYFGSPDDVEFVALVGTFYGINNGLISDRIKHYLEGMYLGAVGNTGSFSTDLATLRAAAAEGPGQAYQAVRNIGVELFQPLIEDEHIPDEEFAAALFHSFLQREPSPADVTTWVSKVQNLGREGALVYFTGSGATQEIALTLYQEMLWLVPDHLGTPRMISERSGSLTGIKRHDYLPFGEEVPANFRNGVAGYAASDNVRQKFTSKERDNETGLDYFGARYYASTQGRFTGVDPLNASARPLRPQSWNRYSYCINNPLMYVDPSGLVWGERPKPGGGTWEAQWFNTQADLDRAAIDGWRPMTLFLRRNPNGEGFISFDRYQNHYEWISSYAVLNGQINGETFAREQGITSRSAPWFLLTDPIYNGLDSIYRNRTVQELLNSPEADFLAVYTGVAAIELSAGRVAGLYLSMDGLAFEKGMLARHLAGTAEADKLAAKGAAHVFLDLDTASAVETEIFKRGTFTGVEVQRSRTWARFGLEFEKPIGVRIQANGTTKLLNYGEMKVDLNTNLYHIVPRTGPSKP